MPLRPWKMPSEARIWLDKKTKFSPKLGAGAYGRVCFGRMKFQGGKTQRVAIKVFKEPLSDEKASNYQKVIDDLRNAGVRIPKMAMVKIDTGRFNEPEWVQVSQLFGSISKGSKIATNSPWEHINLAQFEEGVVELTKAFNAGYYPSMEFFEPFRDSSKGGIPIDLDLLVEYSGISAELRANILANVIKKYFSVHSLSQENSGHIFRISLFFAKPGLRKILEASFARRGYKP